MKLETPKDVLHAIEALTSKAVLARDLEIGCFGMPTHNGDMDRIKALQDLELFQYDLKAAIIELLPKKKKARKR